MDTLHQIAVRFWSDFDYFLPVAGFLFLCAVVVTVAVGLGVVILRQIIRAVLFIVFKIQDRDREDDWI